MDFTNSFDNGNGKPPSGIDGFDGAEPAPEYEPLPPNLYICRVQRGEYCTTKAGADAFRIRFEVVEGDQKSKTVSRLWTFGEKAMPYTRRDLLPFGLTSKTQLLSPFPGLKEYRVRLVVALQRGNDGREFNDIKRIDIIRIDDSPAAAFMLPPDEGGPK